MSFSPFDSAIFRKLYGDPETSALFSDSAEVRAMLLVEGMLAKVQGELGVIPEDSAFFIQRSSMEVQIDPAALADGMARDGVPVPALVEAFRKAMEAPEHAQYVHWGATSQDIMDTALVLRLRQFVTLVEKRLESLEGALTGLARETRDVVMAARTRSQIATPTTFGAVVAGWVLPLRRHRERLARLRGRLLVVSLSGASGTASALGGKAGETERALAEALKLGVAEGPWHTARDSIGELAALLSLIAGSLGKIGQDVILLSQSEVAEIDTGKGGGSSTMPQKSNPVAAETLVTMGRFTAGIVGQIHQSQIHAQQRDGTAWAQEWLVLPQICIATGVALQHAITLAGNLQPNPGRMLSNIAATSGTIFAEAASFALAEHMPRPEAQEKVKQAVHSALRDGKHLRDVLEATTDADVDWNAVFDATRQTGRATDIVGSL